MTTIKIEGVNSADLRVSNAADSGRKYEISANVRVDGTAVSSIQSGTVCLPSDTAPLATFNSWSPGHLSLDFQTADCRPEIMEAVTAFADLLRENPPALGEGNKK